MKIYKYEANNETGEIIKSTFEVLGVDKDEAGTDKYIIQGGAVSKFFDFDRVGNPVWLDHDDEKLARRYIAKFFEDSLALVQEQTRRIKRVIKAVNAEN